MPPDVVDKLSREFARIAQLPKVKEAFNARGVLVTHLAADAYAAFILRENDKHRKISEVANVKDQ
jgi:tripartite-type tricarboxylate transporter receptor subunit TctC